MSNTTHPATPPFQNIFVPPEASRAMATAALGVLMALWIFSLYKKRFPEKTAIHELGGIPIVTAWLFFSRRYDFLWKNFNAGHKIFKFYFLQHQVVAISGEEGRNVFLNDKNLNLGEGYRLLMDGSPELKDIDLRSNGDESVAWFNRRVLNLLRKDRLVDILPSLFDDVNRLMTGWGNEGRINPFKSVPDLVFQMTVRMASCRELAEDRAAVTKFAALYLTREKSATPFRHLFPWFPGRDKKAKMQSTKDLYNMLKEYLIKRREAKVPTLDAIDILIGEGDDDETIIGVVLGVVFAGFINTGINACWILLYLAANPIWKVKVKAEVESLIAEHTNPTSSEPLHTRLSVIPITAWEDSMPAFEAVQRETLRITTTGTLLRRNIGEDIKIGDKVVPKGSFLAYSLGDVHLNSEFYEDPLKFDPDRFVEGRAEDMKGPLSFLAWGAGRHPCVGMKVAKLEVKMIVAYFLAGYEFDIVDATGHPTKEFPQVDRNDIQQSRPLGNPCFIQFKRTVDRF